MWRSAEALGRDPDIALLFTDIGLPGGMDGRRLAEAARRLRPDLPVLFTSGYPQPPDAGSRLNAPLLRKPNPAEAALIELFCTAVGLTIPPWPNAP